MEETSREREERLKTWSTFLEGGEQGQPAKGGEPAGGATVTQPKETSSSTEPEQPETEAQEEAADVDSTDSSLAGSDDEDAKA